MITILGAGGAIGNELVKLLAAEKQPFRLAGRNPQATLGATEILAADLTDRDQTIRAVPHSFTYTPDAARSLVQLVERTTARAEQADASRCRVVRSACRRIL